MHDCQKEEPLAGKRRLRTSTVVSETIGTGNRRSFLGLSSIPLAFLFKAYFDATPFSFPRTTSNLAELQVLSPTKKAGSNNNHVGHGYDRKGS
jgi:hypothetical protein